MNEERLYAILAPLELEVVGGEEPIRKVDLIGLREPDPGQQVNLIGTNRELVYEVRT